jgi:uncharacterized membrane protein
LEKVHFMPSWKLFLLVAPLVLVIDLVWLGVLMKPFYESQIGELARRNGTALAPRWPAAIMVYLLIPAGIVLFVRPAMGSSASLLQAFAWGAVFGLVLYGVYDCTNRSVLEKWTLPMTMVDILWGCTLCGIGALAMRLIEKQLTK